MKKIENFMLPENTNSLYKNEAISSIGLTRDVADKINELIDAYNRLSEIDLEWKQTQEGIIRKGVLFMKDNLVNSLNELLDLLNDSGFIDSRIEFHCDYLKERLDNLLSTLKEGSTTFDAEIVDMRQGFNGENFNTAGVAVREQIRTLVNYIKGNSPFVNLDVGEIEKGYIASNGELVDSEYALRTKNFLPLLPVQCFLKNPLSSKNNIRIFRYSLLGEFEKEYLNAEVYRLDANKLYKISFAKTDVEELSLNDIEKFTLYHYKPVLPLKPEYFGAVANDETFDNTSAFYSMFEYVKAIAPQVTYGTRTSYDLKDITFEFNGTYYLNGVVMGDFINGVFNNLRLSNLTGKGYLLTLHYMKDCFFNNLYIDGNYKASGVLLSEGYSNVNIKDSIICHFTYYGIRTNGGGGHELNIVGNKIFQTEYMNFDSLKETIDYGCCLHITNNDTDNLVADNIFCYVAGSKIVVIDAGSIMFNNNHIYNASHGEIYIHNTNGVYNGNFFDVVTLTEARGGNFFNGNTFMCTNEYLNTLIKFETENFYGRKSYFANNIFKYVEGYLFEGFNENVIVLLNNYEVKA